MGGRGAAPRHHPPAPAPRARPGRPPTPPRGYAEAAARQAGERLRLQRRLMELLLTEHHRG
ncbi:hypothetical protein ACFVIN_15200, partial [Streptomyces prasinus]|uniref:hypothetical protein n=1 Tax=Streptomyces prasinus TaxID=67345 RepID=UPI003636B007